MYFVYIGQGRRESKLAFLKKKTDPSRVINENVGGMLAFFVGNTYNSYSYVCVVVSE